MRTIDIIVAAATFGVILGVLLGYWIGRATGHAAGFEEGRRLQRNIGEYINAMKKGHNKG